MIKFDVDLLDVVAQPYYKRSISLLGAIERNADFEYIETRCWIRSDGVEYELLILKLTCDGVPDVSSNGIEYKEILGILVGKESNLVPDVWALRNDFPCLLHMNDRPVGMPNILCLYFENITVINRTWTADKFLKRIYWWIENSAKGTLHASDQPVEQFFFDSKYELILPSDIKSDLRDIEENSYITAHAVREDNSYTFFLEKLQKEKPTDKNSSIKADIIFLEFPSVIQGTIQPNPRDLNSLYQSMAITGVSPKELLREKIQSFVPGGGLVKGNDLSRTLIFVRIPITREHSFNEERVQVKAFLILDSLIGIGEKSGFLLQSPEDNKFYKDVMRDINALPIPDIKIFPVEVLKINSKQDYQFQSGVETKGNKFSLIGLGALGSVLFDLWNRSGWGEWVLVDKDHIKPHNLTRHTSELRHIGINKAIACEDRAHNSTGSTEGLSSIPEDVMLLTDEAKKALLDVRLTIDATTTLEYPRKASFDDNNSRHCSVFVTPNGNDAVILLEDEGRVCRLRTLEAQYYRQIIENIWGENHLSGNLGSFSSGASCRDISFKLPYSSIVGLAAILAEQITKMYEQPASAIKIWTKSSISGAVTYIKCNSSSEVSYKVGSYNVFMDSNLLDKIYSIRKKALPLETGGILLGYHDLNLDSIFIVDALPAPSDSKATSTSFQRGTQGVVSCVDNAKERTANIVDYIGEWHSHPNNVEAKPSKLDEIQLCQLSKQLAEDGLPAVQVIAGEYATNVFLGGGDDQ